MKILSPHEQTALALLRKIDSINDQGETPTKSEVCTATDHWGRIFQCTVVDGLIRRGLLEYALNRDPSLPTRRYLIVTAVGMKEIMEWEHDE